MYEATPFRYYNNFIIINTIATWICAHLHWHAIENWSLELIQPFLNVMRINTRLTESLTIDSTNIGAGLLVDIYPILFAQRFNLFFNNQRLLFNYVDPNKYRACALYLATPLEQHGMQLLQYIQAPRRSARMARDYRDINPIQVFHPFYLANLAFQATIRHIDLTQLRFINVNPVEFFLL